MGDLSNGTLANQRFGFNRCESHKKNAGEIHGSGTHS